MTWLDILTTLIALIALAIAIVTAITSRRDTNSRTQQAAVRMVMDGLTDKLEEEIVNLRAAAVVRLEAEIASLTAAAVIHVGTEKATAHLEEEVHKLQKGLDDCMKQRIGLKGEIQVMRNALRVAQEEINSLKDKIETNGREAQGRDSVSNPAGD